MFERHTIRSGSVTTPQGFTAGSTYAGIKSQAKPDLALIYSETPCVAAAVFTTNKIKAAPVIVSKRNLGSKSIHAIIVNAGCANACTGEQGMVDANEMARITARNLKVPASSILVASTGVIGVCLPMDKLKKAIPAIKLSNTSGHDFARAIMTTDTFPKEAAVSVKGGGTQFSIGGAAKGSGMIHPDMATMLSFITTDASLDPEFASESLKKACDLSFNMVTVDGETSTNDSVFLLANGLAGGQPLTEEGCEAFQSALNQVCLRLAKSVARDGEGATTLIEVAVEGAATEMEARCAARTVAGAPLVKAAVHGHDPNWGRIMAALGRSGIQIVESRVDLYLNHIAVLKSGTPVVLDKDRIKKALNGNEEVRIGVCLNIGDGRATAWGCDLSQEYVIINSAYTT
jgi:glutamate N-acetyltransferase / amino-acid N-acetyltransferase